MANGHTHLIASSTVLTGGIDTAALDSTPLASLSHAARPHSILLSSHIVRQLIIRVTAICTLTCVVRECLEGVTDSALTITHYRAVQCNICYVYSCVHPIEWAEVGLLQTASILW